MILQVKPKKKKMKKKKKKKMKKMKKKEGSNMKGVLLLLGYRDGVILYSKPMAVQRKSVFGYIFLNSP